MKLILASAGFYTKEIADKCVELVGRPADDTKSPLLTKHMPWNMETTVGFLTT